MDKKTKQVLAQVKKDKVQLVELHFTDIHGTIKSVTIPVHRLSESLEKGTWFDGSSIEGFTRIQESDMYLKPDADTYKTIPWIADTKIARFICDVFMPDGKPFEGDPRQILKKQMDEAKKLGFDFKVGPELEFFLFNEKNGDSLATPHDGGGYFDFAPRDLALEIRKDIYFALQHFGIEVEMAHHEVAPGQHEINFKYDSAVQTADNAITLKYVVKSIAHQHGLHASFMPKPVFGENGNGMHVHMSLWDLKKKKNVFFDEKGEYHLSKIAKSFVAGVLKHAVALAGVVAPTVNSYKRLTPGYEAPVYVCWGQRNRSALIRIPRYFKGQNNATRCEVRFPDPSCNPYLAFSVMLAAGLDGVKKKLVPPKALEESSYSLSETELKKKKLEILPSSLGEAIHKLKKDSVILDALGEHAKITYPQAKMQEFDEYRVQVTKWEMEKYFPVL